MKSRKGLIAFAVGLLACLAMTSAALAVTVTGPTIDEVTGGDWDSQYGNCFYLIPSPERPEIEERVGPNWFFLEDAEAQYSQHNCYGGDLYNDASGNSHIDWRVFRDYPGFSSTARAWHTLNARTGSEQWNPCRGEYYHATWDSHAKDAAQLVALDIAADGPLTVAYYFTYAQHNCRQQEYVFTIDVDGDGILDPEDYQYIGLINDFSHGVFVVFEIDDFTPGSIVTMESYVVDNPPWVCTPSDDPNDPYPWPFPNPNAVISGVFVNGSSVCAEDASLGDFVWEDVNADGIQDGGEPGIEGVTVELLDCAGNVLDTTTTDSTGFYEFTGLTPGDYNVRFVKPDGSVFSPQDQGGDDTVDSDADPATGQTACTTLDPGENDPTWDAGLYEPASIGDYVWEDLDADGIQEGGEPPIQGVTVELLDCQGNVLDTTTTNGAGWYEFTGLMPGDYNVRFVLPDGFSFSPQDQGGDDTVDSDADPTTGMTVCTTLDSGENDPTWDAGMYQPASLGDFVWFDTNGDGLQNEIDGGVEGIEVILQDCAGNQLASTTTDINGWYQFTGLMPGSYKVVFNPDTTVYAFTTQNAGGDDTIDSDADQTTGEAHCVTLESGEYDDTIDAGLVDSAEAGASLGDYVWHDMDYDGIQDDNEPGIPGVTVNLYDCDGNLIATTVTDATGYYIFIGLNPGDPGYRVEFVLPAGYIFTLQNQGGDDAKDSDADPTTGLSQCVVLAEDEENLTIDAGMYTEDPGIDIEKLTNGVDADDPNAGDAPNIAPGDSVAWTYVVTNTGDVPLSNVTVTDDQGVTVTCPKTTLDPGESMTCTANGTAEDLNNTGYTTVPGLCGQYPQTPLYENKGKATGQTVTGQFVEDEDPSHYCNPPVPDIDIEKLTNGFQADLPGDPKDQIIPGGEVTWTYVVTNTGNVLLGNVTVVDDQGAQVSCPKTELAPGESMNCTATGTALDLTGGTYTGQCGSYPDKPLYMNMGKATGETVTGETVQDEDPSHYCNPEDGVGTGTPGYWKNHPEAWPVDEITICDVTYSKDAAIEILKTKIKENKEDSDKTITMFQALVSAKLNVFNGANSSCIDATIAAADQWMCDYGPVGSDVDAGGEDSPWRTGEPLYWMLDDYNNGRLCAPHRD